MAKAKATKKKTDEPDDFLARWSAPIDVIPEVKTWMRKNGDRAAALFAKDNREALRKIVGSPYEVAGSIDSHIVKNRTTEKAQFVIIATNKETRYRVVGDAAFALTQAEVAVKFLERLAERIYGSQKRT
jgi:hypothetical protein